MVAMVMMNWENAETVQMASRISIHSQLIPNLGPDEDNDDDEEEDEEDHDDDDNLDAAI